jgi:hypothetical protein
MRRHLAFHKVRLETRKILVDERNTMLGQLQPKARVEALYSTSGKALPLPQRPNAHLPRFEGLERLKGASFLGENDLRALGISVVAIEIVEDGILKLSTLANAPRRIRFCVTSVDNFSWHGAGDVIR